MDAKSLNKTATNLIKSMGNSQACKVVSVTTGKKINAYCVLTGVSSKDLAMLPAGAELTEQYLTAYVTVNSTTDSISTGDTLFVGKNQFNIKQVSPHQPDLSSINIVWKLLVVR